MCVCVCLQVDHLFSVSSLNAVWSSVCGKTKPYDDPEFRELIQTIYDIMRSGSSIGLLSDLLPWLTKISPKLTGYVINKKRINFCAEFIRVNIELKRNIENLQLCDVTLLPLFLYCRKRFDYMKKL